MQNLFNTQTEILDKLDRQRVLWLRVSGFIAMSVLVILYDWKLIYEQNLEILVISIGLLVSVAWWYWTMSLIRQLLDARINETHILETLSEDIEDIKRILTTVNKH